MYKRILPSESPIASYIYRIFHPFQGKTEISTPKGNNSSVEPEAFAEGEMLKNRDRRATGGDFSVLPMKRVNDSFLPPPYLLLHVVRNKFICIVLAQNLACK